MFLLKTQSKHKRSTHKLNNNTVTPTAHLVGAIKLTVLPTPALCNSSWRKCGQLKTTKHNIFMFFTTPLTLPVQQTMILKRLLHQIGFCRAAADDANMFLCPKVDCTQHVTETAQRRSPTPCVNGVGPEQSEIYMFPNFPVLITRSWNGPRHLNLEVMSVLVCRVKLSLATTNGTVSTSCLFP